MTKTFGLIGILVLMVILSCANPVGTSSTSNIPTSTLTLATLVGTWEMNYTAIQPDNSTDVISVTITVVAGGAYTSTSSDVYTPSGGSSQSSYTGAQGTISVSGDTMTITKTLSYSGSTPVTSSTSWIPLSTNQVSSGPAIFDNGNLYTTVVWGTGSVFTAQGTVSGLVGTWTMDLYNSSSSLPYTEGKFIFASDATFTYEDFQSTTSTMPSTPVAGGSGTFGTSNGILSITPSTGTVEGQSDRYTVYGSYLILGPTSNNLGAFVKQ